MAQLSVEFIVVALFMAPGFAGLLGFYVVSMQPRGDLLLQAVHATTIAGLSQGIAKLIMLPLADAAVEPAADGAASAAATAMEGFRMELFALSPIEWCVAVVVGSVLGLLGGLAFARRDKLRGLHELLGTRPEATRSDWFSSFKAAQATDSWVILNLKDRRRLMGFPNAWPDEPGSGSFLLLWPEWITDTAGARSVGSAIEKDDNTALLIPAREVDFVEFLNHPGLHEEPKKRSAKAAPTAPTAA